jgi:hypothetical protein
VTVLSLGTLLQIQSFKVSPSQSDPKDHPVLGNLAPAHHLTPLQVRGPEHQKQIYKVDPDLLDPDD